MKPFGPDPINLPCPHCHVYALDGYMSHKTGCPERERERQIREHMAANPPSQPADPYWAPGHDHWWIELRESIVWHWRQIPWGDVALVAVAIAIAIFLLWIGLEGLESR